MLEICAQGVSQVCKTHWRALKHPSTLKCQLFLYSFQTVESVSTLSSLSVSLSFSNVTQKVD
jgi:hypothetical protein